MFQLGETTASIGYSLPTSFWWVQFHCHDSCVVIALSVRPTNPNATLESSKYTYNFFPLTDRMAQLEEKSVDNTSNYQNCTSAIVQPFIAPPCVLLVSSLLFNFRASPRSGWFPFWPKWIICRWTLKSARMGGSSTKMRPVGRFYCGSTDGVVQSFFFLPFFLSICSWPGKEKSGMIFVICVL